VGGNCGAIQDITLNAAGPEVVPNFISLTGGTNPTPIVFSLTGIDSITRSVPGFLLFTASGNISYDNFDATPASFLFSTQGTTLTSFSATAMTAAVPEASTWAMMILGFVSVGLLAYRRRAGQSQTMRLV
jgi:hypothetical protein